MPSRRQTPRFWLRCAFAGALQLACSPPPNPAPTPNLAPPSSARSVASTGAPNGAGLDDVPTRREDIVETIFGQQVKDPYRWLERTSSPEVDAWVSAQN